MAGSKYLSSKYLNYIGGFFDGEGYIGIYRRNPNKRGYRLMVSACNTNEWIIKWLQLNFGGSVKSKKESFKKQRLWRWSLAERQAEIFLKVITKYLIIKRAQAELALQFMACKNQRGERLTEEHRALEEAQMILMRSLKREVTNDDGKQVRLPREQNP